LQTRDFVYVGDVVGALLSAMDRVSTEPSVFNVCTGNATSVRHLADIIAGLCGRPLHVSYQPPRQGEIRHSTGNPANARLDLGFSATVTLEQGLAETLAAGRDIAGFGGWRGFSDTMTQRGFSGGDDAHPL
jgi:UDP-glucose 4-epimerase